MDPCAPRDRFIKGTGPWAERALSSFHDDDGDDLLVAVLRRSLSKGQDSIHTFRRVLTEGRETGGGLNHPVLAHLAT